jgi:predicted DNA-binding ribbon-helix-helix protein
MMIKRSIQIDGTITSISMEPLFWDELDRRATNDHLSWQDLARQVILSSTSSVNRSSALRTFLLEGLRDDILRIRKRRLESWWLINSIAGTQEVGTRSSLLLVGRDAGNDIIINDDEVSRKHAMLSWDGGAWWCVDVESKNGIFVKGRQVPVLKMLPKVSVGMGRSELVLINVTVHDPFS